MNEKKNIESPFSGIPKKNPFGTPEGYFETLQDRIEARIKAEETILPRRTKVIRILKPVLSLAASFALIYMLVYYPLSKFMPKYLESNQVALETESIEFNLEEDYLAVFSTDNSLIEYMTTEETEEVQPSEEVYAYMTSNMSDSEFYAELTNN